MQWMQKLHASRRRRQLKAQAVSADPESLMGLALQAASSAASFGDVPVGAVLWTGGKIVAVGFNSRELNQTSLGHAEIDALAQYSRRYHQWRLPPDSILAVTAEPCLMCTGALLQARVSRLIYGCQDTKNAGLRVVEAAIQSGRFDHRFEITAGVRAEECAALLSHFFQQRRKSKALN